MEDRDGPLSPPSKPLFGPDNKPLDAMGQMDAVLQKGDTRIEDEVFIVRGLTTPLLGLPAILRLNMIPQLHIHLIQADMQCQRPLEAPAHC